MTNKFLHVLDPEYSWVFGEVASCASVFTSKDKMEEFVSSFNICPYFMANLVVVRHCLNSDRVFTKPSRDSKYLTSLFLCHISSVACWPPWMWHRFSCIQIVGSFWRSFKYFVLILKSNILLTFLCIFII